MEALVLHSFDELRDLEPAWQELASSCSPRSTFQFFDWVVPWWEAFGTGRELMVPAMFDGGRLVAVLPLMRSADGQLWFVGSPLNDRNGMLAGEAVLGACWAAAIEALLVIDTWAHISFGEAADTEDLMALESRRSHIRLLPPAPSPVVRIGPTGDAYLPRLPRRRRRRWLEALERLAGDHQVRFECLTHELVTNEGLADFHRRRISQWESAGRLGLLTHLERSSAFEQFLGAMGTRMARRGHLALTHLVADGTPIASGLYFRWGDTVLDYMGTYDREFAHYSPGTLCTLLGIELFARHGVRTYDFGRGNEPYKFDFLAASRELAGVEISRGTAP